MTCDYSILIVDDSPSILALLSQMIEETIKNVTCICAAGAEEALNLLISKKPDLIMLDIQMDKIDGFELKKILQEHHWTEDIPVIFMTGSFRSDEFIQKGFDLGAIDYVLKPFDKIPLMNKIKLYLKLFQANKEIKAAHDYTHNILNHMDNIIFISDGTKLKHANRKFLDFFGFPDESSFVAAHSCVCDFFKNVDGYLQKETDGMMWLDYLLNNPKKDVKVKMFDKNDKKTKTFIAKISGIGTNLSESEFIISFTDITETENLKQQYKLQATTDTLTKIHNRQKFNDIFEKEFYGARRYDKPLSLIMADIDHFKLINDTYGHQTGDKILVEFATILKKHIRLSDSLARWGGEEFMIVAAETSLDEAVAFATNLRDEILAHEFSDQIRLTASFGVAQLKNDDTHTFFLKRVDEALYRAKEAGRNRITVQR